MKIHELNSIIKWEFSDEVFSIVLTIDASTIDASYLPQQNV